jgi:hypothetical protein
MTTKESPSVFITVKQYMIDERVQGKHQTSTFLYMHTYDTLDKSGIRRGVTSFNS